MTQTSVVQHRDRIVPYTIKTNPRSRRFWLRIYPDGRVCVTVPRRASIDEATSFLQTHLEWVCKKLMWIEKRESNMQTLPSASYASTKEQARELVQQKIEQYGPLYNVNVKRMTIKNQKSKWGSCSRRGNLNFNYRIVFLSETLIDYLIVHELCHLKEFNHSKKFWNLVSQTIPNYRECRKELRLIKFKEEKV